MTVQRIEAVADVWLQTVQDPLRVLGMELDARAPAPWKRTRRARQAQGRRSANRWVVEAPPSAVVEQLRRASQPGGR